MVGKGNQTALEKEEVDASATLSKKDEDGRYSRDRNKKWSKNGRKKRIKDGALLCCSSASYVLEEPVKNVNATYN
ncbi:hypothetical protein N665_0399s0025 [Sinapis alba]|nr:hypothetical protein N665_0399s0025 [Sinapis alba]